MTNTPDIAAKIAAARALEAAATPGPWYGSVGDLYGEPDVGITMNVEGGAFYRASDMELAAHARNHHAALWDVVEAAHEYVTVGTEHPQVRGELFRALDAAIAKLAEAQ